jgi:flagellar basal body-associated protein FliL
VTIALTEVNRDELINRDGKRRLRKAIVDRLNQLLPHGRVLNAYFGRLMID